MTSSGPHRATLLAGTALACLASWQQPLSGSASDLDGGVPGWIADQSAADVGSAILVLTTRTGASVATIIAVLAVLARVARRARIGQLAALGLPPLVRCVALGGISSVLVFSPTQAGAQGGDRAEASGNDPVDGSTARLQLLDDAGIGLAHPAPITSTHVEPQPVDSPTDDLLRVLATPGWTVAVGESFWSIAEDLASEEIGRDPSDQEVFKLWRSLIEANRERLVDPENPDLLMPGQVLVLPP